MAQINTYLTFNGNCREAMVFYQECLGGKLIIQSISESPLGGLLPQEMKDYILHSTLIKGDLILMGSDMVPSSGLIKGNKVSLILQCESESEIREYYRKLSVRGSADQPLEDTHWGTLFGGLTDQFGHPWLLSYNKNHNQH